MAAAKTYKKQQKRVLEPILMAVLVLFLGSVLTFAAVSQAQGFGEEDSTTIGVGSLQATSSQISFDPATRIGSSLATTNVQDQAEQSVSDQITDAAHVTDSVQRSITVIDPEPAIIPLAVDETNPEAIKKASEVCSLDYYPTAKRISPDVHDGTWSSGVASAYSITTNDDGNGNFGVTTTASGIPLTNSSVTVAVPASQSHLLGRICQICYNGETVIATVTDTGGFESMGRVLDLAPGVYKAFGFDSYSDWGTRTVYYRFL